MDIDLIVSKQEMLDSYTKMNRINNEVSKLKIQRDELNYLVGKLKERKLALEAEVLCLNDLKPLANQLKITSNGGFVNTVFSCAAKIFEVDEEGIRSNSQKRMYIEPRMFVISFIRDNSRITYHEICDELKGRGRENKNHASVKNAENKHRNIYSTNKLYRSKCDLAAALARQKTK